MKSENGNPCTENWDKMDPKGKNKFCAVCSKEVVDMTKSSWEEIHAIQLESSFNTCGRYTPTQFKEYPKEMAIRNKLIKPVAATAAVLLSLSNLTAQTNGPQIYGKITDENNKPLAFCQVLIPNTEFITLSDFEGYFKLLTDSNFKVKKTDSLLIQPMELTYKPKKVAIQSDSVNVNLTKSEILDEIIIKIKMEELEFKGLMTIGMIEVVPAKKSFIDKRKDFIKIGKRDKGQF